MILSVSWGAPQINSFSRRWKISHFLCNKNSHLTDLSPFTACLKWIEGELNSKKEECTERQRDWNWMRGRERFTTQQGEKHSVDLILPLLLSPSHLPSLSPSPSHLSLSLALSLRSSKRNLSKVRHLMGHFILVIKDHSKMISNKWRIHIAEGNNNNLLLLTTYHTPKYPTQRNTFFLVK